MYGIIRPVLFRLDPEKIHHRIIKLGAGLGKSRLKRVMEWRYGARFPSLVNRVLGIAFDGPVGLAAGFDKNAELLDFLPSLGFGFAEIGSVTAKPSEGNPRPRMFRLPEDEGLINRLGLNNIGADAVADRLKGKKFEFPVGLNIAKTHDPAILGGAAVADFCHTYRKLHGISDFIVLNISCPNTREGKTFEEPEALRSLLSAVMETRASVESRKPLLLKLSPDLTPAGLDSLLQVAAEFKVDGFVVSNTSTDRKNLRSDPAFVHALGAGGLSGRPLEARSTGLIRRVYLQSGRKPVIGVGGIFSAEEAYQKILAGASLVELFTGLIYKGPGLIHQINRGLVKLLKRDGFASVGEAVGAGNQG